MSSAVTSLSPDLKAEQPRGQTAPDSATDSVERGSERLNFDGEAAKFFKLCCFHRHLRQLSVMRGGRVGAVHKSPMWMESNER